MRVLFCGGGTGGHLMPGLAVWESVRNRFADCDAVFVGTGRVGERNALASASVRHEPVYDDGRSLRSHAAACLASRRIVRDFRPDIAVGLGGYASIAGVLAARTAGVPIVLLEQNAVPGRATTLLSRLSQTTCRGFEYTGHGMTTGTPVRAEVAQLASLSTLRCRWADTILVIGGSQGSHAVNEMMLSAAASLRDRLATTRIVHQTGASDVQRVLAEYRRLGLSAEVTPYIDDLPQRLAEGPIVVSRAGGTTLAELACAGVPAILIPHANSIRDHQLLNARQAGLFGARVVEEHESLETPLSVFLRESFSRMHAAKGIRQIARPGAADFITEILRERAGLPVVSSRVAA